MSAPVRVTGAFAVAFLIGLMMGVNFLQFGPRRVWPLAHVSENEGRLHFVQPDGTSTILDVATGRVVERGGRPPVGWRKPDSCGVYGSSSEVVCVFPAGEFRFNRGYLAGRTPQGTWKAFLSPPRNIDPYALYAVGDHLIIESTGFLSAVECVQAGSGRSLWLYVFARRYDVRGPINPFVVRRSSADPLRDVDVQGRGLILMPDPTVLPSEPYSGTLVLDPEAQRPPDRARKARVIGWQLLGIAVFVSVAAAMGARRPLLTCGLVLLGLLLLSFGYIGGLLLACLSFAFLFAAVASWARSDTFGRVLVSVVVGLTAGLFLSPWLLYPFFRHLESIDLSAHTPSVSRRMG